MTNEEQIKAYKTLRANGQAFFVDNYEDADRIIEALEKQIPAEVFYDEVAEVDATRCPTCGTPVDEYYCDKFCWHCGQSLLWNKRVVKE